ncbi:MAG: hypothetical protein EB168_11240 [Euryarchaeota archaeon]|nr:hypothetical protein [Euryarchaeota archaeon]
MSTRYQELEQQIQTLQEEHQKRVQGLQEQVERRIAVSSIGYLSGGQLPKDIIIGAVSLYLNLMKSPMRQSSSSRNG